MDEPSETSRLASTIRLRRKDLGLTVTAAAKQARISRRTWSEIENEHRLAQPATLVSIERVLQVPAGSLTALEAVPRNDDLAALRREVFEQIDLLVTREELELVRLDITRRRLEALKAQLEQYEQETERASQDASDERP